MEYLVIGYYTGSETWVHLKVYQLLAHGRWFSPGTLASSTTKTGQNDIAESDVKYNKSNHDQIKSYFFNPTLTLRRITIDHGQATGKLYHLWL
jgi:hypothetical protein